MHNYDPHYDRDHDYPTVRTLSKRVVKSARKPHECYACRLPIKIGQRYERTVVTVDGGFEVWSCHSFIGPDGPTCPPVE